VCEDKIEIKLAVDDLWIQKGSKLFSSHQACNNFDQENYEKRVKGQFEG
jgi:hypothetical protein